MPGWGDVSGSVLLVWHEKVGRVFELTFHLFRGVCLRMKNVIPAYRDRRDWMHRPGHDRQEDGLKDNTTQCVHYHVESNPPISNFRPASVSRMPHDLWVCFITKVSAVSIGGQILPALFGSFGDLPPEVFFPKLETVSLRDFHQPGKSHKKGSLYETSTAADDSLTHLK